MRPLLHRLSENDTIHDRSKHIRLRYHFIRDEINKNRIRVVWVPTGEQQADILTKGLSAKIFCRLREILLAPDFC